MKYTFLRRFTAGFLDVILGFALGYLLHWRVGHYFATRAVATFHIGSPGTLWKGIIPWFLGLFGVYFYTLPLAFFLVFLPEAIWGRSFGKLLLVVKIGGSNGLPATEKSLWTRFMLKTIIFWGMTLALVLGSWQTFFFSIIIGLLILLAGLPGRLSRTRIVSC